MKLAAIDIGSNAVRLQITNTIEYQNVVTFKKLEYIRFPLRLGFDVFTNGRISEYNKERFLKLMNAYKMMIDLYEVDQFYACATSAMRESENGLQILDRVRAEWGLDIEIINGDEEARLINEAVKLSTSYPKYLHVDVGGGSTELNYYINGEIISSRSFNTGSVRRLGRLDGPDVLTQMQDWIHKIIKPDGKLAAIGTGGNINKLFELSAAKKESRTISMDMLQDVVRMLTSMSLEERMLKLQLNADRADVIIPASEIYLAVMALAKVKKILVPDVGLKDGINIMLYERGNPNHGKLLVRN